MNASRDRSINVQKSSAVQELKHFASRYSEHEVQSATETVFGINNQLSSLIKKNN